MPKGGDFSNWPHHLWPSFRGRSSNQGSNSRDNYGLLIVLTVDEERILDNISECWHRDFNPIRLKIKLHRAMQ